MGTEIKIKSLIWNFFHFQEQDVFVAEFQPSIFSVNVISYDPSFWC